MTSKIKPHKLTYQDFFFENSLRSHLIKRPTSLKNLDFRYIHSNKNRKTIYRALKNTRKVNSVSLILCTASQPNFLFTLLAQKAGIKKINIEANHRDKDIIPLMDKQAQEWYPMANDENFGHQNNILSRDVGINKLLPKTLDSLKFSLYYISRMSMYRLSQAVKKIRNLQELELNSPVKNENALKKDAVIFDNMFTFKKKLQRLCFNSHIGRNSLASFKDSLKKSPLKSVTVYQDLTPAFGYDVNEFKNFLASQKGLENLSLIVLRRNPQVLPYADLIGAVAQNPHIKNFNFDTQYALEATEANAIKEAFKNLKDLRGLNSQFNYNYNQQNAGRIKLDTVCAEASKMRQLTKRVTTVKETKDPQANLKIIKSVCHDLFHSSQLRYLEIFSKIEIHETAILYLLWSVKNMPSLETLKVKTLLDVGTMAPMPDIQKMPNFTTPTSLKTLALEWATEFEYTEKIIDFIALQKNLEDLHLGILRVHNPSSKDHSKLFNKLTSLTNLKSFHVLSTSISLFRSTFFDLYTKIVKNSGKLEKVGLTFLAPFFQEISPEALVVNTSKIELSSNVIGFLEEVGRREKLRKLYLNFKLNIENEQNLGLFVDFLCQAKNVETLSVCLEMFYKKEFKEEEMNFLKKHIKKQVLRLQHLKYCFVGMQKGIENSPAILKLLKGMSKRLINLEGFSIFNGVPLQIHDKSGKINN